MTNVEKYKYWEMLSDYDMDTVGVLMKNERWMNVAAVCHTAVERLIKGMIVYHTKKEAPKSSNITFLMNKLCECQEFIESDNGKRFNSEKTKYYDLVIDIMYYHISDYPFSYQKVKDRFIEGDTAMDICGKTRELIGWFKSFQV